MTAPPASTNAGPDGEVACAGYFDDTASRDLLASLPLEHLAYNALRIARPRLLPRLINRLRRERLHFSDRASRTAALLVPADAGSNEPVLQAWALQSYPNTTVIRAKEPIAALRAAAERIDFVLLAGRLDALHPSAAGIVMQMPGDPDVVFWNRFTADAPRAGSPGVVFRRPAFDAATWRHGAVSDGTLALRGAVLARAPDEVLVALAAGRMHALLFWLAGQDLRWRGHPEALTVDWGGHVRPTRAEFAADVELCRRLLAGEGGGCTLEPTRDAFAFPYVLLPESRARKVSVLIPFRDRAELTLACLDSLARQELSGELEVILVNNQSQPGEADRVASGARRLFGDRAAILVYDRPFNHSAQNNLAAEAASGEVIVVCNNDIVLNEPETLEHLAAWALQPGIATVGCRLENPERRNGSYGHVFTSVSGDPFRSPLGESADPLYGEMVHAVPGNTLALAAMDRARFLALGGLDAERFPIGYNDVDLMLRCTRAGLTHLYLGHVSATHRRGSSRTGDNEDFQALLVNQLYSAEAGSRLFHLHRERVGDREPRPNTPAAA